MSHPTDGAMLPGESLGATTTVPETTDNAQWLALGVLAACVVSGAQPVAEALDAATQLVTVIIVLLLVRALMRAQLTTPTEASRQGGR